MLPLPGAPSTSWAMYQARLHSLLDGGKIRVYTAFWLFGEYPWLIEESRILCQRQRPQLQMLTRRVST